MYGNKNMAITAHHPLTFTASLSLLRSNHRCNHRRHLFLLRHTLSPTVNAHRFSSLHASAASNSTFVEHLAGDETSIEEDKWEYFKKEGSSNFDVGVAGSEMRKLGTPSLEVKELEELPEQWRRTKLAWLCKELPVHSAGTLVRLLNGQKKWLKQEDATYVAVHCMRTRENEAGFRVC